MSGLVNQVTMEATSLETLTSLFVMKNTFFPGPYFSYYILFLYFAFPCNDPAVMFLPKTFTTLFMIKNILYFFSFSLLYLHFFFYMHRSNCPCLCLAYTQSISIIKKYILFSLADRSLPLSLTHPFLFSAKT